jgi:hypothetical protein
VPFEFIHSSVGVESSLNIPAIGLCLTVRLPHNASDGALTVLETVNAAGPASPPPRDRDIPGA